jgi:S-adenosylmethionine-diacylgycerolhomoserine-N-methlytransferase
MLETIRTEAQTFWHLLFSPVRGDTHQQRLESFYAGQARGYDSFRRRLLHGRQELVDGLPKREGQVWIDLGCGTAENIDRMGDAVNRFQEIHLVDLSESLMKVARRRVEATAIKDRVQHHIADVCDFNLGREQVDLITFSYSLTMIPQWFRAIQRAYDLLRPGGIIGVVDFFVSPKYAAAPIPQHRWFTRTFWPTWFAMDNVYISKDHLPMLQSRFETMTLQTSLGKIPYLPLARVPYYVWVGRKE